MNLFERIPGNFFSILSSKNKEIYFDALMLLHRFFQHELNIELSDYKSALIELLENRAYEIEDDDEIADGGLTLSGKAMLIVNRLVATGWVDREIMDGTFKDVITPRDYAIQVIRLLHDLSEPRVREYNSLVFSTYAGLREAYYNQPNQMYEAIVNARSNTERLHYELRTLYHGIRGHLRKIQGQTDVNTLLANHFDDYKALADRIYHPIKTMDSVYRYMSPIKEILANVIANNEMINEMRIRAINVRGYANEEEAGREIINSIDYVLDIYQTLGGIVNEIDKKHSTYTKLSIDAIRYHMTADQTIAGKLATVLKAFVSSSAASEEKEEIVLRAMESYVNVNRQEFFDRRSAWKKNIKSRRITTEPLNINEDEKLSIESVGDVIKLWRDDYSLAKIIGYMNKLFGSSTQISTSDIDINGDAEFIKLLFATIRAGEYNTGYKARIGIGSVEKSGYTIPVIDFFIPRS